MAVVTNEGGDVTARWTADLQVSQGNGGFVTVDSLSGIEDFGPGANVVSDIFCYDFPPDARRYKVRFSISGGGSECHPQGTTGAQRQCALPEETETPTRVPTNTRVPTSTRTSTQ
jgi:hypothetical protein